MKNLGDAIILRNHVLNMLEQADLEYKNREIKKKLTTFVVVGGGFGGVETVGALNDFVRGSVKTYYHNIMEEKDDNKEEISDYNNNNNTDYTKIILVSSTERLLPEMDEELGEFALQKLRKSGVEVILDAHAKEATEDSVKLDNGMVIPTYTLIWTAGVASSSLIGNLPSCEHDKAGRVTDNKYLQAKGYSNVFAIGDCALIIDPNTGKPCAPTAQHAIRQAKVASENIISTIKRIEGEKTLEDVDNNGNNADKNTDDNDLMEFDYQTRGNMATIGKRNGVAILFGIKIHGFVAWWLWRTFYLINVPTIEKKLRVMIDWTIDIFFNRDVTRLKMFASEREEKEGKEEDKLATEVR
jgi:NADH dehydrogenase